MGGSKPAKAPSGGHDASTKGSEIAGKQAGSRRSRKKRNAGGEAAEASSKLPSDVKVPQKFTNRLWTFFVLDFLGMCGFFVWLISDIRHVTEPGNYVDKYVSALCATAFSSAILVSMAVFGSQPHRFFNQCKRLVWAYVLVECVRGSRLQEALAHFRPK